MTMLRRAAMEVAQGRQHMDRAAGDAMRGAADIFKHYDPGRRPVAMGRPKGPQYPDRRRLTQHQRDEQPYDEASMRMKRIEDRPAAHGAGG